MSAWFKSAIANEVRQIYHDFMVNLLNRVSQELAAPSSIHINQFRVKIKEKSSSSYVPGHKWAELLNLTDAEIERVLIMLSRQAAALSDFLDSIGPSIGEVMIDTFVGMRQRPGTLEMSEGLSNTLKVSETISRTRDVRGKQGGMNMMMFPFSKQWKDAQFNSVWDKLLNQLGGRVILGTTDPNLYENGYRILHSTSTTELYDTSSQEIYTSAIATPLENIFISFLQLCTGVFTTSMANSVAVLAMVHFLNAHFDAQLNVSDMSIFSDNFVCDSPKSFQMADVVESEPKGVRRWLGLNIEKPLWHLNAVHFCVDTAKKAVRLRIGNKIRGNVRHPTLPEKISTLLHYGMIPGFNVRGYYQNIVVEHGEKIDQLAVTLPRYPDWPSLVQEFDKRNLERYFRV
jgi:hypothetical protein